MKCALKFMKNKIIFIFIFNKISVIACSMLLLSGDKQATFDDP